MTVGLSLAAASSQLPESQDEVNEMKQQEGKGGERETRGLTDRRLMGEAAFAFDASNCSTPNRTQLPSTFIRDNNINILDGFP